MATPLFRFTNIAKTQYGKYHLTQKFHLKTPDAINYLTTPR